jgi:DNA gyrase subunit B/topoisomerase-4 subunit B
MTTNPAPQNTGNKENYTASDISVLVGLEAVRKRPGMYIGGVHKRGLHHLLWEIVDNAIDEAFNGHASEILVRVHDTHQTITVEDNGRGIPTDLHPKYKCSALELIMTKLHAGGKFEGSSYKVSGGLHGVGASVVNALSDEMVAEVVRGNLCYSQTYSRGVPQTKLLKGKPKQSTLKKKSGTSITFTPDSSIFQDGITFDLSIIRERLDVAAYLHRGLKIRLVDDQTDSEQLFFHEGGIEDYLQHIVKERGKPEAHEGIFSFQTDGDIRLEVSFCWTQATDEHIRSFVNGIPTRSGGTHEGGLKSSVLKVVRNYIKTQKLQPKGVQIGAEDIREGWVAVLSAYVVEPQFQGQTKERLNNPEVQGLVEQATLFAIEQWMNENSSVSKAIVDRIIMAAKARAASRAASQLVRRKSPTRRLTLPGKLADCALEDPRKCELFIVEGDSAGGSAKMGRDRKTQAILPLRGKILNTNSATLKKVAANKELSDVVKALGCGIKSDFSLANLRYDKIILLMDADADGHHISTLLLTFFYRHLPALIENGHVYLAQPPLYRVSYGKEIHWALTDDERDAIVAKAPERAKIDIQRFKGLGEMMPGVLRDTTLDPKKRTLLRVSVDDPIGTNITFEDLMGKDASARFRFIMENAHEVDDVDTVGA